MKGNIIVENLTKRYGGFTAVDNISFVVPAGTVFAFLGPNGAGKTTTIKMLTTLQTPTAGKIRVHGFDITKNPQGVRKSIGIVFQDPSLDDELTAWENMEYHGVLYHVDRATRAQRIPYLLSLVGLAERKDDLVKTFSGGMKRRLEIARALVHQPAILFLDEPTVGLDPQTRNQMWSYINALVAREKMTVFFTTHYLEEVERVAAQIAIIDQGKIIKQGTSAQIKKSLKAKSLEDAFLKLTGREIRAEDTGAVEQRRLYGRMWGRR